ncbi:BRISC and BRCA1-A complex member 1 [Trichonephila clavipes]|nr:BRISC and BRCA1-A complex member 1 [Trichonephila clavipes]
MSANEDGIAVKLNTYVESKIQVRAPSKTDKTENNSETVVQKNTASIPEDESGKTKSDKIELRNSIPHEPPESMDSCCSSDINEAQIETINVSVNVNIEPESPSRGLNGQFKRMQLTVPKINYTEKIIFCLDMSSDMEQTPFKLGDGSQHTPLSMVKRTIELFVENKHFINRKHEFSLMVLYENATWVREFTNDPKELIDSLQDLNETQACTSCDLASIVTLITDKYEMRIPRKISLLPCLFRVILVYGRSSCMIQFSNEEARDFLINYPFLILDIVYIHEPPTNENKCQEIFEALCDLDEHNKSYIYEITRNTTKLHNSMAKLLTHPVQRCAQKDTTYSIRLPYSQEME